MFKNNMKSFYNLEHIINSKDFLILVSYFFLFLILVPKMFVVPQIP